MSVTHSATPPDETRVQVLKEDGRPATSDKWMRLIRGGPPEQPAVLFEYDVSRSEEVPLRLLDGFEGVLQADGYAGYNRVCRENPITRIGCWDHARRKFVEASKAAPAIKKGSKVSKADVAIGKIRKLYLIEDRIKDLEPEQKKAQRQALSRPVLDDLKDWLETNSPRVPKDSLTWIAINYTLSQWGLLIGYCEDGRLNISNALAENAIRPFAVGRRYVQVVIMCTFASDLQIPEDRLAKQCGFAFSICCRLSDTTTHNHKLSKKASNALGGLNRVAVISGG